MKEDLLFHNAYESFYKMAAHSNAFASYCQDAFGADFSQDGFSDLWQVEQILKYIPKIEHPHILDIGCGNGKMLQYLQKQTGAFIYGFDYSENAIDFAAQHTIDSEFRVGIIGEIEYPSQTFDTVISMDSLYFAPDMSQFVGQIRNWLKPEGVFFAGYEEGDLVSRTENAETTIVAQALRQNDFTYQWQDISRQTWAMLNRKRESLVRHQHAFMEEQLTDWYDMIFEQTACAACSFEEFNQYHARYIFVARKT